MVDIGSWQARGLNYEVDGHGVAWLRLNRPEKRNAIDRPLRNALLEAFHEVSEDPAVKVGVITGIGTAFCSGADITQEGGAIEVPPERRSAAGPDAPRDDGLLYGWSRLMERIWRSETPFIASVNGAAVGAGCQLALACDLILAADGASFWEIFVRRGLPLEGRCRVAAHALDQPGPRQGVRSLRRAAAGPGGGALGPDQPVRSCRRARDDHSRVGDQVGNHRCPLQRAALGRGAGLQSASGPHQGSDQRRLGADHAAELRHGGDFAGIGCYRAEIGRPCEHLAAATSPGVVAHEATRRAWSFQRPRATTRVIELHARFGDKVALVTGAGSGIGRETARLLATEGARVLCLDVDSKRVDEIVAELTAARHEAHGHCCDVADPSACKGAVAATIERFGRLDVLCNVAGISMMRTIDEVDDALWSRMIAVNLAGPFYLCRAAVPALVESHGNIVNVASQAGLRGYSHLSAYAAAKGGLVMLTRALAVELAPRNVRVNCVCPGAVLTNIADSIDAGAALDPQVTLAMMQRNPKISPPEDVARAIVFLASDDASSATGAVLPIDGGSTA